MKYVYPLPSSLNEFIPEPMLTIEPIENPLENKENESGIAPRRSKIQSIAKSFGKDFTVYLMDDTPMTIVEAFASPDAEYWKDAVRSGMDSITLDFVFLFLFLQLRVGSIWIDHPSSIFKPCSPS